jgi:hypothetical protein
MERVAGPEVRLAMMLALHIGQRQSDLLKLTWKAWDGKGAPLCKPICKPDKAKRG